MNPQIELARRQIAEAFREYDLPEARRKEIAFHLTDWLADLESYADFLENPRGYTHEQTRKIVIAFLVHAPDHLKRASEIVLKS